MQITEADRKTFEETGLLSVKGLVPKSSCASVKRSVMAELDRLKLRTNGKISATKIRELPLFQQTGALSQMVKLGPELEGLFSAEVFECATSLGSWKARSAKAHAQLLLSLPQKADWSLARLNWHLDLAVPTKNEAPGVQAFVLIDEVAPRGGATLAIAGSHRLHYLTPGEPAHAVLRRHELFGALFDATKIESEALLTPHTIEDIPVSVYEMSGRAGDVFFMDMRVLHSPSVNASKNIRMMVTSRYVR